MSTLCDTFCGYETEYTQLFTYAVRFVLRHLAGRGEQVDETSGVLAFGEIRMEKLGLYLSTVHVDGEEFDVVVLSLKRIFVV